MKYEYNGQQITLPDNVSRYLKKVESKLRLPKKIRDNVLSDLVTGMCVRNENGETYEKIMEDMGNPSQVAEGLNREMEEFTYGKSPWRWGCLGISILSALVLLARGISHFSMFLANTLIHQAGVIGGADGPTAIFVSTAPGSQIPSLIVAAVLLVMGVIGFYALGHLEHKK